MEIRPLYSLFLHYQVKVIAVEYVALLILPIRMFEFGHFLALSAVSIKAGIGTERFEWAFSVPVRNFWGEVERK